MSVKFNTVERSNPADSTALKRFYPFFVSSGRLTPHQLAQNISRVSTISSADKMAVLEAFLTVIPNELAECNAVELGDFGTFWLKANSEGCNADEVRSTQIAVLLPRFYTGKG